MYVNHASTSTNQYLGGVHLLGPRVQIAEFQSDEAPGGQVQQREDPGRGAQPVEEEHWVVFLVWCCVEVGWVAGWNAGARGGDLTTQGLRRTGSPAPRWARAGLVPLLLLSPPPLALPWAFVLAPLCFVVVSEYGVGMWWISRFDR